MAIGASVSASAIVGLSPSISSGSTKDSAATPALAGLLTIPEGAAGHIVVLWSWSGKRIGALQLKSQEIQAYTQSALAPNGSRLLLVNRAGLGGEVVSTSGRKLAKLTYAFGAIWADDSQHLCFLHTPDPRSSRPKSYLEVLNPGHSLRIVGQVPSGGDHENVDVVACDIARNQAVVIQTFMGADTTVTYVNLKTGALSKARWPDTSLAAISGNGRYAALSTGEVVSTNTWRVVAHVVGQPIAISWSGHDVLSMAHYGLQPIVYDWQIHKTVWRPSGFPSSCPCTNPWAIASARHGSDELAINVGLGGRSGTTWIVAPTFSRRIAMTTIQMSP
jgi:hypothetical protein